MVIRIARIVFAQSGQTVPWTGGGLRRQVGCRQPTWPANQPY